MRTIPARYLFAPLLLLQLFLTQYSYAQTRVEDSLLNQFRNDIRGSGGRKDIAYYDNETRISYLLLMSVASIESLVKYTDDSIPVVRAEMFKGLIRKNADDCVLRNILERHINDTARYKAEGTDVVMTWRVNQNMRISFNDRHNHQGPLDYKGLIERLRNERGVLIPGARRGMIIKDSLLKGDTLTCSMKGCRIVSFLLTIGDTPLQGTNVLTCEMKELLSKTKPLQKIYFDDIKAEFPDNRVRNLGTMTLRVK